MRSYQLVIMSGFVPLPDLRDNGGQSLRIGIVLYCKFDYSYFTRMILRPEKVCPNISVVRT